MHDIILGATTMANLVAATFFFHFWRKTKDRFFGFFSLAFVLLATNRVVLAFIPGEFEHEHLVYVIRLVAFLVIVYAIIDKNRASLPEG
jgi:hypothetical protein